MLNDELVKDLCELGLTSKQAKIYLSVVVSSTLDVASISEKTAIHKQDVYKILPKLEKMGLLAKTITNPIRVEAIPIETALGNLIGLQKQKIKGYEETASTILAALKNMESSITQNAEERIVVLPKDSNALKNKVELAFQNARKAYSLYTPQKLTPRGVPYFIESFFREFVKHEVEVRVIVEPENEANMVKVLRATKWPDINITVKAVDKNVQLFFSLVDDEAWIPLEYCSWASDLVTKNKRVVNICRELFERVWKDPETRTLFQHEYNKKLPKKKIS